MLVCVPKTSANTLFAANITDNAVYINNFFFTNYQSFQSVIITQTSLFVNRKFMTFKKIFRNAPFLNIFCIICYSIPTTSYPASVTAFFKTSSLTSDVIVTTASPPLSRLTSALTPLIALSASCTLPVQ